MWMLTLGGVFLAASQACVFCRLPSRHLSGRLAQLCSQMGAPWKDCKASWNFSAFALDEVSMNKVTEKTHRVLRVMEIKKSVSSLPSYWQWLQKIKLPEYTREALCAPTCRGSTILYNCSTCESFEVHCWPQKRCFPGSHDLREARILLLFVFGTVLLLGVLSLLVDLLPFPSKTPPHLCLPSGPISSNQKMTYEDADRSQPAVVKRIHPQLPLPLGGWNQPAPKVQSSRL
ncbi:PREDICTED: transmembrane protein 95 isoform X2 [Hipposideros armiger]|uniref:Transmembrane protein 95 isoform X2 n=1 Tax=Hipposideros armiger TaxID=186990 RepID=A0A8B7T5Y7_HIPAR|nr:PREDICTED: transmembrane protein 95 isoform X2 [Hipposideros armiger]